MRLTIPLALLLLATPGVTTSAVGAAGCGQHAIDSYTALPGPKALVGNDKGCVFWSQGALTRAEVEKIALGKCEQKSGKPCEVVQSADGKPGETPKCSSGAEAAYDKARRAKVLVGNTAGCTVQSASSLSAATRLALDKCRRDFKAECQVIKSVR